MSSIGKEMFFRQYERILAEQEDDGRVDYDRAADQAMAAVRDEVADRIDDARKRAREG